MSTHADGDTTMAALAHVSALIAAFLGPLLILVLADDTDTLVKENAKNALNFQIIVFIAVIISFALTVVLIGLLLLPVVALVDVVLVVLATVKANNGEVYSYPLTPSIV
ncbi:DUF4870 domain-containing protein [Natrinema caseinilyticum]|uniref:DUF4870 domain-containing protein n=1 Tax=Natrinema caseinilyticum TaxID=2961570 RepID=UPI0020C472B0|nr:DUF4870 domain-containing protein [Natrinema caseinilyticum]